MLSELKSYLWSGGPGHSPGSLVMSLNTARLTLGSFRLRRWFAVRNRSFMDPRWPAQQTEEAYLFKVPMPYKLQRRIVERVAKRVARRNDILARRRRGFHV